MILRIPVKNLSPERKGEVFRRVCNVGDLGSRTFTGQRINMHCGNLADGIKLF